MVISGVYEEDMESVAEVAIMAFDFAWAFTLVTDGVVSAPGT